MPKALITVRIAVAESIDSGDCMACAYDAPAPDRMFVVNAMSFNIRLCRKHLRRFRDEFASGVYTAMKTP